MHSPPTTKAVRRKAAQRQTPWTQAVPAPLRAWLTQEFAPVAAYFRAGPLLALFLLTIPILLATYQFAAPVGVDIGGTNDFLYLRDFFVSETGEGATFRWTGPQSTIVVPAAAGNSDWVIVLRLGSKRPPGVASPPVQVFIDDRLVGRFESTVDYQDYRFQIARPVFAAENLTVRLVTDTFDPPGDDDNRPLGVSLDRATLTPAHRAGWQPYLPPLGYTLLVVAIVGVFIGILGRLEADRRVAFGCVAALLIGVALGQVFQPARTVLYLRALLLVAGLLVLTLLGLRPLVRRGFARGGVALAPREENWLLGIVLFGAGLNLAGVIYPGFRAHDILFHAHRIEDILHGRFLFTTLATEFGTRQAPYPPVLYMLFAPFAALARDSTWPLRFLAPLLNATSAILVCYLARRCRLPEPAPLLAAFFSAIVPATFQLLWWGFFTNLFGQWATLVALTLIVGHWSELRRPPIFIGVVASLCLTLLSHPGTFVLTLALLPLLAVGLLISEREDRRSVLILLAALGISLVVVFLLYYRHYAGLLGDQLQDFLSGNDALSGDTPSDRGWEPNYVRLRVFAFPFLVYFVATIAAGIGLARRRNRLGWTLLAMLLTSTIFAIIHIVFGVWVRYFVFLAPALALGAGVSTAWVYRQGRLGRLAAYGALAYGTTAVTLFWFAITVAGQRSPYP